MLIVILIAGAFQRAKEVEKDRKDSLAAHVDSGGVSSFFFFTLVGSSYWGHSVIPVLLQSFIQIPPSPKVP